MEPFQILKYEAGQFYRAHHDQNSGLFTPQARYLLIAPRRAQASILTTYYLLLTTRRQGARVYTFFMYLSTPEAGGGTRFTDLNLTVPAVKGSAVLWPSVTSDDPDIDEPLTHHAMSETGREGLNRPRLVGRGWLKLGAAWIAPWRWKRPPEGQAEV
jgi:hypothetical protein